MDTELNGGQTTVSGAVARNLPDAYNRAKTLKSNNGLPLEPSLHRILSACRYMLQDAYRDAGCCPKLRWEALGGRKVHLDLIRTLRLQ